ncbi:nuclear transport factor 2 family protein [Nocardia sp. NBC_01009]|uniref:nuclear transport factor 2 family protein n=1 Tax=Nocardia sp. NBC_01009 TaxID=2975996 RepID=UPI003869FF05|nr:nuclear transport factor 2 family protein [Nocardia sp. NBC_01009]
MTSPDSEALVERYLKIIADHDYEQFGELLTDNCEFTLVPIGYTWRGRADVIGALTVSGDTKSHDDRSAVKIINWFTNDEYVVVEYERGAVVGGVRVNIDGYCWIAHMRDGRFDSIREYINPSNPALAILVGLVLRSYPRLTRRNSRAVRAATSK